ncbi:hypothetical protein [Streptomyces nymphaeiformis]|uniref:Uncharacterized protein n=1 Tax=Streptomyces nymphaeiformis TaxID=2663842 RepID=A0A7W7U4F7_9ACTN|nr:hypothetical protein [Streptomyces nymphaeiformis]MBB4984764.1 hypothetical protein [Streptomyces nymphaeiformis]
MEYTIIRVYRVVAGSQAEATDRLMEAFENGVQRDYLAADIVKPHDEPKVSAIHRPVSWWALARRQLLGR